VAAPPRPNRNAIKEGNVTVPREREYDSNAERQKAYRERQRREQEEQAAEDRYVAENMKLQPLVTVDGYRAARRRQEAYARWRYRAWRSGEVASL
jgi:hypothetical protein